jgi:hypothetical protein
MIAAIIVGIEGWDRFTKPLIESIWQHEPECQITVVDNESTTPYPQARAVARDDLHFKASPYYALTRIKRACYSQAINEGAIIASSMQQPDWYIVLSNDVLCTGPFAHVLASYSDDTLVGPLLLETPIPGIGLVPYIEGWCMAFPRRVWDAIGGFDEGYLMSSFEDVDASQEARKAGFWLVEDKELAFKHLDQRQRFYLPGYGGSEAHNMRRFMEKNGVTA